MIALHRIRQPSPAYPREPRKKMNPLLRSANPSPLSVTVDTNRSLVSESMAAEIESASLRVTAESPDSWYLRGKKKPCRSAMQTWTENQDRAMPDTTLKALRSMVAPRLIRPAAKPSHTAVPTYDAKEAAFLASSRTLSTNPSTSSWYACGWWFMARWPCSISMPAATSISSSCSLSTRWVFCRASAKIPLQSRTECSHSDLTRSG